LRAWRTSSRECVWRRPRIWSGSAGS
jgi:hypothetical protein